MDGRLTSRMALPDWLDGWLISFACHEAQTIDVAKHFLNLNETLRFSFVLSNLLFVTTKTFNDVLVPGTQPASKPDS